MVEPTAEACCFGTLLDAVAAINAQWKTRWSMATPGICFRGADDEKYDLNPSLLRHPHTMRPEELALLENNMWLDFRLRCKPLLGYQVSNAWAAMLIQQHHGLPTRLLDWSRSLAVAAYFAVRDINNAKDGAVWMLAGRHLMEVRGDHGPWRTAVGDLRLKPLEPRLDSTNLDEFYAQQPMVLSPDQLVPRIVAQKALYTIHSFRRYSLELLAQDDSRSSGAARFLHKIVIPAAAKASMRSELSLVAGVREESLFPDLDGFARDFVWEQERIARREMGEGSEGS